MLLFPLTILQSRGCHQRPLWEEEKGEGKSAVRNLVGVGWDVAEHSTIHKTTPTTENDPAPIVNSAEGERSPAQDQRAAPLALAQ